jgi:MFS family permease
MLALVATLTIQALVALAALAPAVLAPVAAPEIGVATSRIGIYTAIVYGAACVSSLTSGRLIAALGPMRLSQASLALCGLGSLLVAAGTLPSVLLGAVLLGLGYGPVTPASSQILIRTTPAHRRSLVFSLKQTGVPLGGVLAGALVPPLLLAFGWRAAALVVAIAALVVAVAVETLRRRLDADEPVARGAAPGVLDGVRLVLSEPALRRLALASLAFAAAQLCFASFVVAFLRDEVGRGLVEAGSIMAAAQAAGVVARILWGWAADRLIAPRHMLGLLGLGMAAATALVGLFGAGWPLALMLAVALLHGATAIGWNGVYLAEVARLAPPGLAGAATGGALFMTFLGVVLSPPLFTLFVEAAGSYRPPFWALAAASLAGGLACLWPRR